MIVKIAGHRTYYILKDDGRTDVVYRNTVVYKRNATDYFLILKAYNLPTISVKDNKNIF